MNITPLRPTNPETTARLIARTPAPQPGFERESFLGSLPMILTGALEMILCDFDMDDYPTANLAVACRILAATIERLER